MRMTSVGKPSAESKRMAGVMIRALEAIIGAIKPGAKSAAVDQAGRQIVEQAGLGKYWLHRTGYSIGLGFPPPAAAAGPPPQRRKSAIARMARARRARVAAEGSRT